MISFVCLADVTLFWVSAEEVSYFVLDWLVEFL